MDNILWVIQQNLISDEEYSNITEALSVSHISWMPVKIIPFTDRLEGIEKIDISKNIIAIGSTNLINNVYKQNIWKPGVFFDPQKFNYRNWGEKYKDFLLNNDYEITTIEKLHKSFGKKDLFIRPLHDSKSFNGQVFTKKEFLEWTSPVMSYIKPDTEIVVSTPKVIKKEWRFLVIENKIITGSLYRKNNKRCIDANYYKKALEVAKIAANIYSPHSVFVIDIGQIENEYRVIEVGCFNAAGFYACDTKKIVKQVSKYVQKQRVYYHE